MGGILPRELCGRIVLYSSFPLVAIFCASSMSEKACKLRQSACQSVMHEIQRPDTVRHIGNRQGLLVIMSDSGFSSILQLQFTQAIQTMNTLSIDDLSSITQCVNNKRRCGRTTSFFSILRAWHRSLNLAPQQSV